MSTQEALQDVVRPRSDPQRNFRFFDNRQKYLLFVHTCSEKWVVASRVGLELANIHPRPPALRAFDAGLGDGTVLLRVMRAMHDRFPHIPFYIVGKEISLEDVRLALQKMSDRFFEHPATVLVLTNLAYADAPWLAVKSLSAASSLVWHEVPLAGDSAYRFEQQITDLVPFLSQNWKAGVSAKTGNPVYERPVVLVLYREDHKFLLDPIIPRPGGTIAIKQALELFAVREIEATAAGEQKLSPRRRHPLIEGDTRTTAGEHLGRHQSGRAASDDGDLGLPT